MLNLCLASALPVGIASFISTFCPYPVGYGETGLQESYGSFRDRLLLQRDAGGSQSCCPRGQGQVREGRAQLGLNLPRDEEAKGFPQVQQQQQDEQWVCC